MKILIALALFSVIVSASFAGNDCVACNNTTLAQSSINTDKEFNTDKALIAPMGAITKEPQQDYSNFCRYMSNNAYRRAFRHLRDHHKQQLENHYAEIKCSQAYGPPLEFATAGGARAAVDAMTRYLTAVGKKDNKDYLTPILNYLEPHNPRDKSLLDIAQEAIDTAAGLEEPAIATYEHLKKKGAKHSYYYCKAKKLDLKRCLKP